MTLTEAQAITILQSDRTPAGELVRVEAPEMLEMRIEKHRDLTPAQALKLTHKLFTGQEMPAIGLPPTPRRRGIIGWKCWACNAPAGSARPLMCACGCEFFDAVYEPQPCEHKNFDYRIATFSNGSEHIVKQCLVCDYYNKGQAVKKDRFTAEEIANMLPLKEKI